MSPLTRIFSGRAIHPPVIVERRYEALLVRAVQKMTEEYEQEIGRLWERHGPVTHDASLTAQARILTNGLMRRFRPLFASFAPQAAGGFITKIDEFTGAEFRKDFADRLKIKPDLPATEKARALVAENVGLIKSIQQKYHEQVEGAVMRAIQTGKGRADVFKELRAIEGMTDRRARLIARDQVSKATTAINEVRWRRNGIEEFVWIHSGGGKDPRPHHQFTLNGNTYRFDDPPIIDLRTGERGLPGQLINCHCTARPVISFD